jgi:hypothetical protein
MAKIVQTSDGAIPDLTHGVCSAECRVLAVLTQDDAGQYTAYVAIKNNPDDVNGLRERQAHHVAGNGTRLSYRRALFFFPGLVEQVYRR